MPLLIFAAVALVVLVLRVLVGLFTSPASTLARLGSWILVYLGIVALSWAIMLGIGRTQNPTADHYLLWIIGSVVVAIALFIGAAWLGRVRRRAEIRREYRLHDQAVRQMERQELRRRQ